MIFLRKGAPSQKKYATYINNNMNPQLSRVTPFKSSYTSQVLIVHDGHALVLHNTKKEWTDVGGKEDPHDGGDRLVTLKREMQEEVFGNDVDRVEAFFEGLDSVPEPVRVPTQHPTWLWILTPSERPDVDRSYDKATNDKHDWVALASLGKGRRKWNYRITSILALLPSIASSATAPAATRTPPTAIAAGTFKVLPDMEASTIVLTEKFDTTKLQVLIALNICNEQVQVQLRDYLKTAQGSKIPVRYELGGIGRMRICQVAKAAAKDADPEASGGYTQSRMKNVAKGSICHGIYDDCDIKNCHPSIIEQLLVHHGLPSDAMRTFNVHRDDILGELMRNTGTDKDTAKELIFKILYGGNPYTWCTRNHVDPESLPTRFMAMKAEMDLSTTRLLDIYPVFRDEAIARKGESYFNIDGVALSLLAQTCEKHCLLASMDSFVASGLQVGSLIHDGLHCKDKKHPWEVGVVPDEALRKAEHAIKANTGFSLVLTKKPFQVHTRVAQAYIMKDHVDGGEYILRQLDGLLVEDASGPTRRVFFKYENVWTDNVKQIKKHVARAVFKLDVLARVGAFLDSHSRDVPKNELLARYVLLHPKNVPGFIDGLWESNIGKLCFSNGWFDFIEQRFSPYGAEGTPETTLSIQRPFPLDKFEAFMVMKARADSGGDGGPTSPLEVQVFSELTRLGERITAPIFNNNRELASTFYEFLSRAMAGMIQDKQTAAGLGARNSGKGVLMELMMTAFGPYCKATNAENFAFKATGGDTAKLQSWMIDYEFRRLAFTNEVTMATDGSVKLNGNMIKKFGSGGDQIEARKNHVDEMQFKLQAHLLLLANDLPPIEPSDAKETMIPFHYPSKFLQDGDARLAKRKRTASAAYYKADEDIKKACRTELADAWLLTILCCHWFDHKVVVPASMKPALADFTAHDDLEDTFCAIFVFTPEEQANVLSVARIAKLVQDAKLCMSVVKYTRILAANGCRKVKSNRVWKWHGIVEAGEDGEEI